MTHTSRLLVGVTRAMGALLMLLQGACAALPMGEPAAPPPAEPGWRVAERVGQAVALPPGQTSWHQVEANAVLAPGTEVATGGASRLILDQPGAQMTMEPMARVVLPRSSEGGRLEQRDGIVRYRIARPAADPFRLDAGAARTEVVGATFRVELRPVQERTEIEASAGEVRVVTRDGRRVAVLQAGEAALAEALPDQQLAVRSDPAAAFAPVEPVALAAAPGALPHANLPAISASAMAAVAVAAPPAARAVIGPAARSGAGGQVAERAIVPAAFSPPPAAPAGAVAGEPAQRSHEVSPAPAAVAPEAADGMHRSLRAPRMPARSTPAAFTQPGQDPVFERLVGGVLDGLPRARDAARPRAGR